MGVINRGYEQGRFVDVAGGGVARMRRSQNNLAGKHSVLRELGVGTNDPEKAMHILSEQSGGALMVERIQTNANPAAVILRKSRGDLDAKVVIADDDNLGDFLVEGYVGANNGYQTLGDFRFEVDGSVTDAASGAPVRMVLKLASGSGLVERLRLDSSGNMGIGMNDPSTKLTVEGAVTLKEQASADTDAAAYGQMWVKTATPNELYFTTDAGNDIQITSGTSLAGGSGSGDITSVVAGAGMTGGATSGAATLNVIGGTGITANADDIEISDNGVTLAKMAGIARGKIIYGDASGNPAVLAVGDADQVLTTDGADISWEDAGSGSGDITSVVAGSGMTGGATSGAATVNVIGGDGITANADEVEATVDGSTIELSASDGSGAIRIKDDGVTYAKIQNVTATDRILGRDSAGAGVIEEIDPASLRTMLNVANGATATTDTNTTYSISCVDGDNSDEEKIRLTAGGSGSGTDDVVLEAGTGLSIARSSDKITFTNTVSDTNTTYSSGDGLDLTGTTFSTDLKSNGGLVIESTELAVDLGASSITGTLAVGDGGSGQTSYTNGQLLVGNTTGNTLAKATLTAGTGISITNGSGAVTITNTVSDTNTFRTVTAGGNTLGAGETLAFTAGTGISIAESAGAVTITNSVTDTNTWRGVTAGGNTLGASETLAFTAGTGISIAESAGAVTITNTVSDTNTTYSPGTLLDVSGTTFNVDLTEAAEAVMADGDYILFLDGGATGSHAKEAVADVATLFAGDGLTASSSVMAVNVDDSTIETSSDAIRVKDNGVTLAKMAGLARGKIIHGDASGDPAALALGSANTVLQSDGTDSSWGTVATAMIADNAVSLAKMAGLARGSIIYGDASGDPAALSVGSNTYVLTSDGTDVAWASAGGGSARSVAGDTDNAIMSWVTSDNTFAAEANLTFDGNSLLCVTGSASAVPCTIKGAGSQTADLLQVQDSTGDELLVIDKGGSIKLGLGGDREVHVEPQSGTNNAGKDLFLKGGKSTGNTEGGDIRFYTSPVGSSGSSVNGWAEIVKMRHDKIVDFKIAGASKTVTLANDAMDSGMMGAATVTVNATEWLTIKVGGNTRYIPVWS